MRIVADFKIAKKILVWGVLFCVLWAFGVREFVYSVRAKVKNIIAWHKKRDARDPQQHHTDPQDRFFQFASENLQTTVSMWFFSKIWNKPIIIRTVDVHLDDCKSLIVMNPTIYNSNKQLSSIMWTADTSKIFGLNILNKYKYYWTLVIDWIPSIELDNIS